MQIAGLTQWDSGKERWKKERKRSAWTVTLSTTNDYEHGSKLAYLRPSVTLVVDTRVMRGCL